MRAALLAVIGSVVGWFGGLGLIVAVSALTGATMEQPVILKGMEIILAVAGTIGGALLGQRFDKAAWQKSQIDGGASVR